MGTASGTNPELLHTEMSLVSRTAAVRGSAPDFLRGSTVDKVHQFHQSLSVYHETPLIRLSDLAQKLGVRDVFVKDESKRFGLNAFKGLGGLFALASIICQRLGLDIASTTFADLQKEEYREKIQNMVFATATDGNHGKGVSWAAGLLGCQTHVYMPRGSSELRAQAIRDAGLAHVEITDMGYDDTVRYVSVLCEKHGWTLVQDTSWPGYEDIPTYIAQGYTTMGWEMVRQLREQGVDAPTHVFLQAGVGAMAGSITGYLVGVYGERTPTITIVEPENIACIYESAKAGRPQAVESEENTIMAGLNCGEPCTITWPTLRDCADHYVKCPDWVAAFGMRVLAHPNGTDETIVSGESGASTTGAFCTIMERPDLADIRTRIGLDENSVVLLISTEGDTDPESYRRIVYEGAYATPELKK